MIGKYNLFLPIGMDSMTLILVKCTIKASLVLVGGARVCVVAVGQGSESILFFFGYV